MDDIYKDYRVTQLSGGKTFRDVTARDRRHAVEVFKMSTGLGGEIRETRDEQAYAIGPIVVEVTLLP